MATRIESAVAPALGRTVAEAVETASAPGLRVASSKLSLWCGRFIEAGWLAAVIVAPLFFNIYSSRVFEPDKLTTVRSIALMMAIAWLVKWVEDRRHPAPEVSVTWRTPLVLPTLILVGVYMISSLLSVAPRTSLLGSYQRLQGAYTTFSYIVIFLLMLQNLRARAQFDRLVNLVILNSLPIAMYGMLQRATADPLPWGGDVTARVAGNMGNAIFIAAYLIMTLFLALGKIADAVASVLTSDETRLVDVVRTAGYVLIALLNGFVVMALSGSRGPQLGMLTGLFFIVLLLAQLLRRKKLRLLLTLSWIGAGLMGGVFLVLLNMPDFKAFDGLRQMPILGRLGTALSFTEGTNAVRNLIWVGASELVTPHDPLVFPEQPSGSFMICAGPDNKDACNAIRPLIGYGPESMYVAYNRFYPPELAHFEARNASPDRSHNETWDALVITGGAGLLAYMFLFGSFFYFGFRWIGLVRTRFEKLLFPALLLASCTISVIAFIAAVGTSALGVGVAFGAALGLLIYLIVSALINTFDRAGTEMRSDIRLRDQVMVIALLSAVMAHFIEIHLGIAIASTRTHFWAFAAMMVVLGMGWLNDSRVQAPKVELSASAATVTSDAGATRTNEKLRTANGAKVASARRRRMAQQAASVPARRSSSTGFALPPWFRPVVVSGLFLGLMLGILAFNFTTNSDRNIVPAVVFWEALTKVRGETSYGILAMFLLTWIIGSLLLVGDAHRSGTLMIREKDNFAPLATAVALCMAVSLVIVIAFGMFIAGRLVDFVAVGQNTVDTILGIAEQLGAFPAYLYLLIGVVMVFGALLMRKEEPIQPRETMTAGGLAMALIAFPIGLWTMSTSNLQPIAADIIYKQAGPWDQQGSMVLQSGTNVQGWDMAIEHYRRAIALAPNEDFYYLWLGRALLEKAKSTQNTQALRSWPDNPPFTKVIDDGPQNWNRLPNTLPSANMSQEDLLIAAEVILREARVINPLNTDHSANLARMWRQSGDIATDAQVRQQRYLNSSREYQTATTLSPNNAVLWNEWASLYLYAFNDYETAMQKLDRSVSIDSRFDQTWLLRGEVLMQQAAQLDQQRQISAQIAATIPATDTQALQDAQAAQQRAEEAYRAKLRQARIEFTNAISVNQNNQQAFNVLTYINQQLGDIASAISVTQALIELNPTDWNSYKNLALLYRDANQPDRAREAAQKALELAPQDQQASLQAFIAQLGNNAP